MSSPVPIYKGSTLTMTYQFTPVGETTPSLVGIDVSAQIKKPDDSIAVLTISGIDEEAGTFIISAPTDTWDLGRYKVVVTFDAGAAITISDPVYIQLVEAI
jgi:hypothetical protein